MPALLRRPAPPWSSAPAPRSRTSSPRRSPAPETKKGGRTRRPPRVSVGYPRSVEVDELPELRGLILHHAEVGAHVLGRVRAGVAEHHVHRDTRSRAGIRGGGVAAGVAVLRVPLVHREGGH